MGSSQPCLATLGERRNDLIRHRCRRDAGVDGGKSFLTAGAQAVDCGNAATQMDMNICAAQEFDAADGDLNATYQLAMSEWLGGRDTPNGQALLAAQLAWLAYRDAHCAAAAAIYEGGSIQPMIYSLDIAELIK